LQKRRFAVLPLPFSLVPKPSKDLCFQDRAHLPNPYVFTLAVAKEPDALPDVPQVPYLPVVQSGF
jgi:hypothetical protein